ncbi:hypothetical protein D3C87_1503800 [compost metagenome]
MVVVVGGNARVEHQRIERRAVGCPLGVRRRQVHRVGPRRGRQAEGHILAIGLGCEIGVGRLAGEVAERLDINFRDRIAPRGAISLVGRLVLGVLAAARLNGGLLIVAAVCTGVAPIAIAVAVWAQLVDVPDNAFHGRGSAIGKDAGIGVDLGGEVRHVLPKHTT